MAPQQLIFALSSQQRLHSSAHFSSFFPFSLQQSTHQGSFSYLYIFRFLFFLLSWFETPTGNDSINRLSRSLSSPITLSLERTVEAHRVALSFPHSLRLDNVISATSSLLRSRARSGGVGVLRSTPAPRSNDHRKRDERKQLCEGERRSC